MDFLLNEREKTLTEMRINEACASDKSAWQLRTSKGGSPAELQALLQKSSAESIRLFVQDRVLCDVPRGPASEENRRAYREYREVLSMPRLQRITPLANQDRSFKPMDEPDSYSVCTYGPSSSEHIQMEPPHEHLEEASKGASWNVLRTEIDAPRRLDCWYYQKRFRDLRVDRTKWRQFSDCLTLDTDRARRSPVAERPSQGELEWLSSAQIHERLHAIVPSRVRDWGEISRGDVPLVPGDILVSMVGFTQVKIARYDGLPNAATRSIYLLRFVPRQKDQSPQDAASMWYALTSDDFLDQVRMELSDRVMKPLHAHFPSEARVPDLKAITPGVARVVETLTHLALGSAAPAPFKTNLRSVEVALAAGDVTWPGKWSCLRRIRQYLGSFKNDAEVLLLTNDATAGRESAAALRQAKVPVGTPRPFRSSDRGLDPELAAAAAAASAVVSLTSASTPLRLASEQIGASHALDIAGRDHLFAFCSAEGAPRDFPARQFVEHLFSETGTVPESVDVCGNDAAALAKNLRELAAQPRPVSPRDVVNRLCQLDSPEEPFARFLPEASPVSPLDRIRPALSALLMLLEDQQQIPARRLRHTAAAHASRSKEPFKFGKFVTADTGLKRRIEQFEVVFKNAVRLTEDAAKDQTRGVVALLIEGETGCGKDELVEYLERKHLGNVRFLRFGIEATEELILSQLFGHVEGAFTGAVKSRKGIFELASPKSLPVFFNEVNSYSAPVQLRLLRVIEHGEFTKLGDEGGKVHTYRGVVLAATNQPLDELVEKNKFRRDLQMRLGPPLRLSPLRDRPEDIDVIFRHVCEDRARTQRFRPLKLDDLARRRLLAYQWPGNGRELVLLIERAFLLEAKVIDEEFLGTNFPNVFYGTRPTKSYGEGCISRDAIPLELCCLEDVLGQTHLNRMDQYRKLSMRLYGKSPNANDFSDWVRNKHRSGLIEQFRQALPRCAEYKDELSKMNRRSRKGKS